MNRSELGFSLTNYHTHTTRCLHAFDTEEDYICNAIANGFEVLGFADHTPWPYKSDFVANMRMRIDQLDDYIGTLHRLRQQYSGIIKIPIGLECEAFPEFFPWLKELKESGKVDYLILGNHYDTTDEYHTIPYFGHISTPELIGRYVETTIAGMRSGLFAYLCHPDLYLNSYPAFDEAAESAAHAICAEAEKLDLPLEYNLLGARRNRFSRENGFIGYTSDEFWKIAAQYHIRAIIGIDAHKADAIHCVQDYIKVREKFNKLRIRVIEKLP